MKLLLTTLICLTVFAINTSAQTGTASDDTQIRELVKTMETGWAKKDGNLFASPFAENADYVVINGMHIKGKAAIANGHQRIFETIYKETNIKTEVQNIRYLTPDIAIAHFTSLLSGNSNGQKIEGKGQITITLQKSSTGWLIAAFQNTGIESIN